MRKLALSGACLIALMAAGGAAGEISRPACDSTKLYPLTSNAWAYYVVAKHGLRAYRKPGGRVIDSFGRLNVNRVPTVFGVLGARVGADCRPVWFRVQLPARPNELTGFVKAAAVRVGLIRSRVSVDLSDQELVLYRSGRAVLRVPVAIGTSATPTPTGRYYVNQRLVPDTDSGPFGPGAIGISAFSEVLTGWTQGGPIAIHGTNQPWSIGHPVSNGCIRVRNAVLRRLWRSVLPGTPVVIRR